MRININLASQKYEDAGEFYLRWGSALALALIITIGLAGWTWKNHKDTVNDRQRIDKLRRQIAEVDRDYAHNQGILNDPKNSGTVAQSNFWNSIIEQRQFSWTQLFPDLEKIMPGRAFLVAIHPVSSEGRATSPDNRLKLELVIDGEKHDNGLELIRHMESSPRFRFPEIQSEEIKQLQNKTSIVEFKIVTFYNPGAAVQVSPAKEGM